MMLESRSPVSLSKSGVEPGGWLSGPRMRWVAFLSPRRSADLRVCSRGTRGIDPIRLRLPPRLQRWSSALPPSRSRSRVLPSGPRAGGCAPTASQPTHARYGRRRAPAIAISAHPERSGAGSVRGNPRLLSQGTPHPHREATDPGDARPLRGYPAAPGTLRISHSKAAGACGWRGRLHARCPAWRPAIAATVHYPLLAPHSSWELLPALHPVRALAAGIRRLPAHADAPPPDRPREISARTGGEQSSDIAVAQRRAGVSRIVPGRSAGVALVFFAFRRRRCLIGVDARHPPCLRR